MNEDDLTPEEIAELERVDALLADPSLWTEPPAELQEKVVEAIAQESGRLRRRRRTRYALAAVAASVVLAVGVTVTVQQVHDDPVQFSATVAPTELAPQAHGDVSLTRTQSGWRITLKVEDLPRRDGDEYYEAWLRNEAGQRVSIGTFNEGDYVTLWAPVSPAEFDTLTVTREVLDDDPGPSGEVVLTAHPQRR
ncbi:anti-sigma factor [Nocardioides marmorisolisilvae]|uniref:Anti-sigma factor n=1 Tax=Nocardioides marmorisolisilvae TaxID=1542737 RepID=A0A3N0DWE0_9ACTN|nr:anti-sigma factor [Nocardioides marmorisolisilvae]RNL79930.1 anti-sigma factor [Nocardioides marmorisolisilvae]